MAADNAMKIAIVGMAFRFPGGAYCEESFWEILKQGRDVIGAIGDDRWATDTYYHPRPSEPGRSLTLSAGLLEHVDGFDAAFFGISPREARKLDPQHRLVLELTWEAMENAGRVPMHLAGSDCAVYLGISSTDYGLRSLDDLSNVDAYSMTGNTLSLAANRISYIFDLRGPSMAVDTACSSSLVALHQACASLRVGESSLAIAGGVNLLMHPYPFVGFSSASMLSAGGKCRAFDASGDGYVRAEGGAILLLKPLERAQADGDAIQAVILATGSNADGAEKSGITIPSSAGQAALLRSTLKQSGLAPDDITYIEAHGTGTAVGDPIETAAIGEVLGVSRASGSPLYIGSVKTNIGHLEPASGMAGLVKTVLSLKHRALPASLNLEVPNPNCNLQGLNLRPVTEFLELPENQKPLCMGVNSFGFGGANAHVLLQEYRACRPEPASDRGEERRPPLFLSAKTPQALKDLAGCYVDRVQGCSANDYYDIACSAATRRQWLDVRLAAWGRDSQEIAQSLRRFANDEPADGIVSDDALGATAQVALVYSGNGSQWVGMGRQLLDEEPLFRRTIDEIETLLAERIDFSLTEALRANDQASQLDLTEVAQPALFALQVGVTRILRDQGIDAQFAVGHSVGEIAAAWAMGALSLEQAVTVIRERSAAQGLTKGSGRMAAVGLSHQRVQEQLADAGLDQAIEVAGINSPSAVTLSGTLQALESLRKLLEPRGIFYHLLDLDYAFHNRCMEPIRQRVLTNLEGLRPTAGSGRFVSTVNGEELSGTRLDARYWWDNIRKPVRFREAIETLAGNGCMLFLEIGPHAILQRYIGECLAEHESGGRPLPTLTRNDAGLGRLLEVAHRCWLLGAPVPMQRLFPQASRFVPLPNYPWQRERHWNSVSAEGGDLINRRSVHPLLGYRLKDAQAIWENHLDGYRLPYLADHVVSGAMVLPGTAYLEMALAASAATHEGGAHEVEDLEILVPMVFDAEHAQTVRLELSQQDGYFRIFARQRLSIDPWTLHAVGRLLGAPLAGRPAQQAIADWTAEVGRPVVGAKQHYALARLLGLQFGPSFQGMDKAWIQEQAGHLVARIRAPGPIQKEVSSYQLHPVLLDSCFQTLLDIFKAKIEAGDRATLLPVRIGRLRLFEAGKEVAWVRTRVVRQSPHSVLAEFWLLDEQGHTLAQLEGCRFRGARVVRDQALLPELWRYVPYVAPRLNRGSLSAVLSTDDLIQKVECMPAWLEPETKCRSHFQQSLALFDALISSFGLQALKRLEAKSAGSLNAVLGGALANPRLRHYAGWLLGLLEEDGLLARQDDGWTINDQEELSAPEDIWLTLLGDYPAYLPDIVLAGRVGRNLPGLLDGSVDPDDLADSLDGSTLQDQLYDASPTYLGINRAAQEIVRIVSAACPGNRRLRILEIAGKAWEFTRQVLPHLPSGRCDYFIADSDEARFERRRAEYAGHGFISTLRLDPDLMSLDLDGVAQFDLVVANHTLHRGEDLCQVLDGIKAMLTPGGLLLMLEHYPDRKVTFTEGLRARWWDGVDERGGISGRLTPAAWRDRLETTGFTNVQTLREPESKMAPSGAFALLAIRPGAPDEEKPVADKTAGWLLLADAEGASRGLALSLQRRLQLKGQRAFVALSGGPAQVIDADPSSAELDSVDGVLSLLSRVQNEMGACDHVVQLIGVEAGEEVYDLDPLEVQERRCISTLSLIQAMQRADLPELPKLWLVTAGAAVFEHDPGSAGPDRIRPSQAPLLGFGRVITNEHPDLDCTLVDLQTPQLDAGAADLLLVELLEPDGEDEIYVSEDARYGARMQRVPVLETTTQTDNDAQLRLGFDLPGQLKNLQWQVTQGPDMATDDIEIRPQAVGLNFRDVMYTMGLLSDEAVESGFAGATLGLEVAGVVTRTGIDVTGFKPGDGVLAFAPACFSSRVVTKAGSVVHKPEAWSFEQAATVPAVFFTVYYALHYLARLQPGEKVLIHGAAGGVGIAAIQLARYLGAEVFATAGSAEKRDFVRLLGADHVMNSRDLAFADQILSVTEGQGIDVVLNSLAGEAINRNLRVLRPFGRFLELGKRDFYENTRIGLRPFKDNISYFGIDADQLMVQRPALATQLFREVMGLFAEGALRPLPFRTFPARQIVDAFRFMQQSRQIGKIVISFDEMPAVLEKGSAAAPALSSDGTYLVTGGLNGFGLKTARWLAGLGAGHLVLLGRRGEDTPGAAEAARELEAIGVKVHIRACDVTDPKRLALVLAEIKQGLPPLRGVFHAAMVLKDATIGNLKREDFNAVMGPKIQGAWNLHQLTLDLSLDWFVLYSSATTFIGNPGQANYVAANMFLESLATYRRSRGLVAISVSWGAIGDVGYLAQNQGVKDSLQSRLGSQALDSDAALAQLGRMMATDTSGLAVMDFKWSALNRFLPAVASARFDILRRTEAGSELDTAQGGDIQALIADRSEDEVLEIVKQLIAEEVGVIMRIPADRLDSNQSLYDLGMDSLMGVELVVGLEKRLGISMPVMALSQGPTIDRIAATLTRQLRGTETEQEDGDEAELRNIVLSTASQHAEDASDEDVDAIVREMQKLS